MTIVHKWAFKDSGHLLDYQKPRIWKGAATLLFNLVISDWISSKKPSDLSPLDLARAEGQSAFCKICFSNWPLKLTHVKLWHSGCELELGKHVALNLICWDNILVCKRNLIGTFKVCYFSHASCCFLMFILHKHYAHEYCFSRLNLMVWSFNCFLTFSNITTLLFTSNFIQISRRLSIFKITHQAITVCVAILLSNILHPSVW